MPYGTDEAFEASRLRFEAHQRDMAKFKEESLRSHLKEKFNVPDEFMDLAVRIWKDGKED